MADIKISALPTATTPLTGAELVPVVQSGVTKQTTTSDVLAVPITSLTASSAVATDASKKLVSVANTGTGNNVLATGPTLVAPALGTPASGNLLNAIGLPIATGVSGLGTGVATALAVNVGTAGSPVVNGGALGTPSSGTVTNLTGTASININGTVGATTPAAGTFTSLNTGQLAGLRNRIINGGMTVQQRAAVTVSATYQYGQADRHMVAIVSGTSISGSIVSSSGSSTSSGYAAGVTSASWTTGNFSFQHRIESLNSFSLNGKVITVSCKIYQNTGGARNFSIQLVKPTSTSDTFSALTTLQTVSVGSVPNSGYTTVSATFAALGASDASLGLGVIVYDSDSANTVVSKAYLIGDLQLELGSVATPFEQRPYGMELALCQRYYYRIFPGVVSAPLAFGANYAATAARLAGQFPVTMRIAPTALEQSGTANNYGVSQAGIGLTVCSSVPTFSTATKEFFTVSATVASGLTVFNPVTLSTDTTNGANAYIGFSAEL